MSIKYFSFSARGPCASGQLRLHTRDGDGARIQMRRKHKKENMKQISGRGSKRSLQTLPTPGRRNNCCGDFNAGKINKQKMTQRICPPSPLWYFSCRSKSYLHSNTGAGYGWKRSSSDRIGKSVKRTETHANEPWLFKLHQREVFLRVKLCLITTVSIIWLRLMRKNVSIAWPGSKTIPQRRENCKLILFSLFTPLFRSNLYLMCCSLCCRQVGRGKMPNL